MNVNLSGCRVLTASQIHVVYYYCGCETKYMWGTCVDLIPAYLYHWRTLAEVDSIKQEKCQHVCMNVNLRGFRVPIASRIHIWWQWLWDRICVGYLCGLDSGIAQWLQHFGGSLENKSSEMSRPCAWSWISPVFGCPFLHKYAFDGSCCQTECVLGTCVNLSPAYLYHWRTLAEVESINVVKCRVLLHNRKFERFSGANTFTNTHDMLVAVGQNMCGVPVWTWFRHISISQGLWRKLRQ
jgi:hypothetical protein